MFGMRLQFVAVLLGLAACLVGVAGVLWFDRAEKLTFAEGVKKCVIEVLQRNPVLDAQRDFARREDRFYFESGGWEFMDQIAYGVPFREQQKRSNCELLRQENRKTGILADGKFEILPHLHVEDHPTTECGNARHQYRMKYNAEMARINPQSINKYCAH